MTLKKIGFFGGSFNPIHLGHINLAVRVLEKGFLDQILFCPTYISPLKRQPRSVIQAKHRLNMLQLALEDVPGCDPYDAEISRRGLSYTIDTVRELKGEIYLIVAEDVAYEFHRWKEIETLLELVFLIVGVRHGIDREKLEILPEKIKLKIKNGLVEIPAMEISSTEIRERLKKRLYCGHLIPGKVLDYIHQNTLY